MAIGNEILRFAQDDMVRLQDDPVRLLEGDVTHGNY